MAKSVLFINPPLELPYDFVDYPWFVNFQVFSAAARVAKARYHVRIVDAFSTKASGPHFLPDGSVVLGPPLEAFLELIGDGDEEAVVIGSSPFLHPWEPSPSLRSLIYELRLRRPRSALILADLHVTGMHYVQYDPKKVFEALPELDAIVLYGGENLMDDPQRLASLYKSKAVLEDPSGPWHSPPPFPFYEGVDWRFAGAFLDRLFASGRLANTFQINALTRPFLASSGCPHRCIFCTSNPGWRLINYKPYRAVPLEVVEQWAYLVMRLTGGRHLFFLDEMANIRNDFEEMLKVLNGLDLKYDFPNGLRADRLSDRAIGLMEGRVSVLSLSAESGDQHDLDHKILKRQDLCHIERVVRTARKYNIPTMVHFIVGFPWETPSHIRRTLDLAFALYEDYGAEPAIQFATPIPGSALYDECLSLGLLSPSSMKWPDPLLFQHRPAFTPPSLPEGYLEGAVQAFRHKVEASKQKKLIINVTYNCINQCVFCAVGNRIRRDLPLPRIKEYLQSYRQQGYFQLDLDGGEPTLHPHLLQIIAFAASIGYTRINVTTNGRRLRDRRFALRLLKSGITNLLVSLHGPTAEVHEEATRREGSFRETIQGLRNAIRLRPKEVGLGVNTTVFTGNLKHLMDLAKLLVEEGMSLWNIQFLTPFGSAKREVNPDPFEASKEVQRVIDAYGHTLKIQVINAPFCLFQPEYHQYLLADTQKLGRTMVFVTEEEVNLFKYLAATRRPIPACKTCPHGLICDGLYAFDPSEEVQHGQT